MTNQPAQPTPRNVADLSEAEINQRVLAKARQMSPAEILALSIRCGIHRPDGGLTPEYGGEPSPHRGGADNGESVAE
jgi:hypothetical protein